MKRPRVQCSECGAWVARASLAQHQTGEKCAAGHQALLMRGEGWIPSVHHSGRWDALGEIASMTRVKTKFVPGFRGQRQRIIRQVWVRPWAERLMGACVARSPMERREIFAIAAGRLEVIEALVTMTALEATWPAIAELLGVQ